LDVMNSADGCVINPPALNNDSGPMFKKKIPAAVAIEAFLNT